MAKRSWWIPERVEREELIDGRDWTEADLAANFRDISRINRYLGGASVVQSHLFTLIGNSEAPASVLDVATGDADLPRRILKMADRKNLNLHVTGLDSNDVVLRLAKTPSESRLALVSGNAGKLPFADQSFDFVLSSLAFHHFSDDFAVQALQEMVRVARRGVIVNDLRRAYLPAKLIWLVTRLTGMNRLTKNDAPLSVLRSRTVPEYRNLALRSGFPSARVVKHPFWRVAMIVDKTELRA